MPAQLLHTTQLHTGLETGLCLHSNLNLELKSGEILLLLGRNGIGKSVLLKTLAGIQPAISGSVSVQGQDLATLSEIQRAACVSLVLATPPQDLRLTALEVVLSGRFRFAQGFGSYSEAEHRLALEHLESLGLGPWAERSFHSLSDGEKQKVMLARCWAQDTPLILLDEPLAFLDYPSRKEFLEQLSHLCQQQGKAAIYSSHDLSLSLQHCTAVLHLKREGHDHYKDPSALSGDGWILD